MFFIMTNKSVVILYAQISMVVISLGILYIHTHTYTCVYHIIAEVDFFMKLTATMLAENPVT